MPCFALHNETVCNHAIIRMRGHTNSNVFHTNQNDRRDQTAHHEQEVQPSPRKASCVVLPRRSNSKGIAQNTLMRENSAEQPQPTCLYSSVAFYRICFTQPSRTRPVCSALNYSVSCDTIATNTRTATKVCKESSTVVPKVLCMQKRKSYNGRPSTRIGRRKTEVTARSSPDPAAPLGHGISRGGWSMLYDSAHLARPPPPPPPSTLHFTRTTALCSATEPAPRIIVACRATHASLAPALPPTGTRIVCHTAFANVLPVPKEFSRPRLHTTHSA